MVQRALTGIGLAIAGLAIVACNGGSASDVGGGGGADTTSTGGAPSTGGGTTSAPDEGGGGSGGGAPELHPVLVAIGAGAWSATSCDRGRTWSTQEFSADREDHSEWAAFGGLSFGNGAFIMGTGWGYPGHVIRSTNGGTWQDLAADAFPDGGFESSIGGVAFDGTHHLLFGAQIWSSTDGTSWTVTGNALPPGSNQLRQLRAFPTGLLVASVETQYGEDHALGNWLTVSSNGGETWSEGTGYDAECSNPIQHWGDIDVKDGVLLVGANALCRSTDLGATWSTVTFPGEAIRDVFNDGTSFFATSGSHIFRSADGLEWQDVGDLGAQIAHGVHVDGTYVVMTGDGQRVFYSDDGAQYEEGVIDTALGSAVVRDLAVGYAAADACP